MSQPPTYLKEMTQILRMPISLLRLDNDIMHAMYNSIKLENMLILAIKSTIKYNIVKSFSSPFGFYNKQILRNISKEVW